MHTKKQILKFQKYLDNLEPKVARHTVRVINKLEQCKKKYLKGYCNNCNTIYLKSLICGLEYCSTCAKEIQNRRVARLWKRFILLERNNGHFVFTLPIKIRLKITHQKHLKKILKAIKKILIKEFGELKCIGRWHFFGDKDKTKFHPHVHIISNTSYVDVKVLNRIRNKFSLELYKIFNINSNIVLYYNYTSDIKKKVHLLFYMTRNTFTKLESNEKYALMLFKFRNSVSWGYKKDDSINTGYKEQVEKYLEDKKEDDSMIESFYYTRQIIEKRCIICDSGNIQWSKVFCYNLAKYLFEYKLKIFYELESGYLIIVHK